MLRLLPGTDSAHLLVKILTMRHRLVHSIRALESPVSQQGCENSGIMKRADNLFEKIISDDNLSRAIDEVNSSHRWNKYPTKPNRTVLWVASTKEERIKELREIIENGFEPAPCTIKERYDSNAMKWRRICEPRLYPDQYVHHALIQVLEPIMMKNMYHWCCGSIKERGAHYGIKAIKKWMRNDPKGTRWCAELDIRHFYESTKPIYVIKRFKELIKDARVLDLIERVTRDGIQIGNYTSQWFENVLLQELDRKITEIADHYVRYLDNFTIFAKTKRQLNKVISLVKEWLSERELELKGNWQKFRTKYRNPNALGYRFNKFYTYLRKRTLMKIRKLLKRFYRLFESGLYISMKFAQGLLSRLGMYRHCNSVKLYGEMKPHTQRKLKNVIRKFQGKEKVEWEYHLNMYLEQKAA